MVEIDVPRGLASEDLKKLEILGGVSPDAAWTVLESCPVRILKAGAWLLTKGQPNRHMYFVLDGKLGIYLDEADHEPVARLDVGQTVGEMSVIDRSPASAHVVALTDSRLLEVDDETFWRLINASHQFAVNLLLLLAQRMRANNTSLHRFSVLQRELERDATVDALTGLFNRRWWDDKFARLVGRAHRSTTSLGLMILDIDYFKRYNDSFGHIAGDQVLRGVSSSLASNLRPTDLAARFGGEELVVALPGTEHDGLTAAAERVRAAIGEVSIEGNDGEVLPQVTVSIGIASLLPEEEPAAFFQRADAALYRAKAAGRNRVEG